VHARLIETYPLTLLGFNWDIRRWEGRRFYDERTGGPSHLAGCGQLWETGEGRLVAAVHPEGDGEAHLQVHPEFRHLEADLFAWAEAPLAVATADGAQRQLDTFVYAYDTARQQLLTNRGYVKQPFGGVARRLRLPDYPLEIPAMGSAYRLRTTQPTDLADAQRIADLLNAAFNRDFHNAQEYQHFTRWFPVLACLAGGLLLAACLPIRSIRGSGEVVTQELTITDFARVEVHHAFQVAIHQGKRLGW
jgi:hypothetical protein